MSTFEYFRKELVGGEFGIVLNLVGIASIIFGFIFLWQGLSFADSNKRWAGIIALASGCLFIGMRIWGKS